MAAQNADGSIAKAQTLKNIQSIELPGAPGKRFDYLKIDYKDHYLFSAHLGADQIYIIDTIKGKLLKTISGTPGVEGIEYVSDLNKIYTSNWRDHSIGVIDLKTMSVIKKIPAEMKPDGSAYADAFHKLYVSDEQAKALIVIDVLTDKVIKTIRFESETGMPQYDALTKKIYLNLQGQNIFAVINPQTDAVEASYPVAPCVGNHGMAIDSDNHLAFLGCEGNSRLAVFDLVQHKVLVDFPLPDGVDVIAYDSGLRRVYAACYSGAISVIQADDNTHLRKLEDFKVEPKVHSLTVDLVTHKVYAPEQEVNGKPVSRLEVFDAVTP